MLSLRYSVPILISCLLFMGGAQGCVSRPEAAPTAPVAPVERTTINAPTVVNQPPSSENQLTFQVTRDPNNPNRGLVLVGNQPVAVKMEGGVWMFDVSGTQQPPPSQPSPAPAQPSTGPSVTGPAPSATYNSLGQAREMLAIEQIELQRVLLNRMKTLAANAGVTSLDEFNIVMQRIEQVLQEMQRVQAQGQSQSTP